MERNIFDRTASKTGIPPRANDRFTSPLVINSPSQRRSLFSRPGSQDGSTIPSDVNMSSPNNSNNNSNTRIPRPSQTRGPHTMPDAYKLAIEEEENAAQGSPSPAPRSWRTRRDSKSKPSPKVGNETPSDLRQRRRRITEPEGPVLDDKAGSVGSSAAQSLRSEVSESSFEEKLRRHAADQGDLTGDSPKRNSGLFSKSKLGTKVTEMGKDLVRKTSRGSLDGGSPAQSPKTKTNSRWLPRRFSSRKSDPSNSMTEQEELHDNKPAKIPGQEPFAPAVTPPSGPASLFPDRQSPVNKSFAWDADADFTAGDLQFSNGPPVAIGRTNTKIDEIRAREVEVDEQFAHGSDPRPRNTRIDEIRAAEIEAAQRFLDEPPEAHEDTNGSRASKLENDDSILRGVQSNRSNPKTDDLRAREIERLSRRALATTRLDEIRERDAEYRSRSSSPELTRPSSRELLRSLSPVNGGARKQDKEKPAASEEGWRKQTDEIALAPAVALSTRDENSRAKPGVGEKNQGVSEGARPSSLTRDDSRDVLRRLARATSTTPSPEQQQSKEENIISTRGRDGREAPRQRRLDGLKNDVRLTVGFAGLRRNSSVDSGSDKRSNLAQSDSDPIERIEGEMQLFAPLENHSERGSLRAPSPEPDEDALEKTPRAPKPDPLTQPTPRVTGFYVETPATVKVEKLEPGPALGPVRTEPIPVDTTNEVVSDIPTTKADTTVLRGRNQNGSVRRARPASAVSAKGDRAASRSTSAVAHRRSRSLPRPRSSLINSARPPTVKDDLLEIQRANHVEDSTLDDLADLLDAHEKEHAGSNTGRVKFEDSDDDILDTFDRMQKSLQTGLLGIQTAKRGIERLENKVSHVESTHMMHSHDIDASLACPVCHGPPSAGKGALTYVRLPMPRLWNRQKGFRFTLPGLLLFVLSLWYIAESSMCYFYCKPVYCYPGKPCDWSMDDPRWGYALPVKLDQWTTGGKGRAFADRVRPEVTDWLADVWDVATGTDITQVDTSHYSWDQKRQHRRRLARRGLVASSPENPENSAKFAAWRAVRLAKDQAEAAREMGYTMSEEESMGADERL